MISPRAILFVLLALALVRGILYASIVPPWQAPDEPAQFERTRASLTAVEWNSTADDGPAWYNSLSLSLFQFGFWDFLPASRKAYSPDTPLNSYISLYQENYTRGNYSGRLPYLVMGSPLFLGASQDIALQLYLVRLTMVLMNVGIIYFAYLIIRTLFPHDMFLLFGVPILILFNPQHTHLLATVNNGNMAELLTVIVLFLMVKGVVKGWTWVTVGAVLLFSLIAIWTKATTYFLPFAVGTIAIFYLWQYRRFWRWLLPVGGITIGLALYFAPERLYLEITGLLPFLQRGNFYLDPLVPIVMFRSFWAMPGWLTLQLHPFWYQLVAICCILSVIGLVLLFLTKWHEIFSMQYQLRVQALIVLAAATLAAISILLGFSIITGTLTYRQGRSIYPVIVPISLFLMLGWRQLIPQQWRIFGLFTLTAALFLFDSLVLFNYIVPFFYSRY